MDGRPRYTRNNQTNEEMCLCDPSPAGSRTCVDAHGCHSDFLRNKNMCWVHSHVTHGDPRCRTSAKFYEALKLTEIGFFVPGALRRGAA